MVDARHRVHVAVLLATYNGARFIEPQISSLKSNTTPFTLHWLDDHSTDDTRESVRSAALRSGIKLREWHQSQHLGYPATFFKLLECVDADLYLFCDQDDVWQPGKIDAAVANLLPDIVSPVICFTDPWMFMNDSPDVLQRVSDAISDAKPPKSLEESRVFISFPAFGHTQALTRPLREIFLRHKEIACTHAVGHSWWMYLIGVASGTARMLTDAPTTLYRRHGNNFSEFAVSAITAKGNWAARLWRLQQQLRPAIARQAAGFILAAPTLPASAKRDRLVALARLVAHIDRRQSPAALLRLLRRHALWPSWRSAITLAATCLVSDTKSASPFTRAQRIISSRPPEMTGQPPQSTRRPERRST